MSMFDYIEFNIKCPLCEKDLPEFQTRDLQCTGDKVEFKDCTNFYSSCDYCNAWIEFTFNDDYTERTIDCYEMKVIPNELDENSFKRNESGKIVAICGKGF